MLFQRLNLPIDFISAERNTRCNDIPLPVVTRNKVVTTADFSVWKLGLSIRKEGTIYRFATWTVHNKTHVLNFDCYITSDARVLSGKLNCFDVGYISIDQDYVNVLLDEFKTDIPVWDEIQVPRKAVKILKTLRDEFLHENNERYITLPKQIVLEKDVAFRSIVLSESLSKKSEHWNEGCKTYLLEHGILCVDDESHFIWVYK